VTDSGRLLADFAWRTKAGHAAELLPAIEHLLARSGVARADIGAVFVCRGPGSYGGLRVGISTAMGLAFALGADLLGVSRLEADAYVHAGFVGSIVPVHAAGRGEIAWAVYESGDDWQERAPARLSWPESLVEEAPAGALICGEVADEVREPIATRRPDLRIVQGPAHARRAITLAELAWPRYQAGARDNHHALEPIYLREPNITRRKGEG
jgi:tRNA threonylcarbamoyladenosine biosynthesis protein TsaB